MFLELVISGMGILLAGVLLYVMMNRRKESRTLPTQEKVESSPRPRTSWSPTLDDGSDDRRNWLVGRTGNLTHKTFYLGHRTVTIGRGVSNPIQVFNGKASRVHCRIESVADGIQIVDMNSANGTLVNGKAIQKRFLKHGDEIHVGDDAFVFHEHGNFVQDDTLGAKAGGAKASDTTRMVRPELMPGFGEDTE